MDQNTSLVEQTTISADLDDETSVASHREVIQTVIGSMDQDQTALVNHSDAGDIWKFKYGSVEVFVQLTGETDDDTLTVWSSILKLPAKDESRLTRKLLEMNWVDTYEARFGIFNDEVVVLATRTVADLSPGEISRAITVVATIADDHDEVLQAEFSA
ncbi:YbjN domain-containing protein [Leptolyngbya sp. FACHB-261]|uniref:YbjN domain-containing protein n=1 Tax=Leptolyngbya sp. FACHB-261 TaxID=2692806 RepID=UPI0016841159|nr:YbjN domain-containing protein [Leptolyngbya sp. FACHB-261]MBD2102088.1 YbjN domain-containing protein [Leptolyngbya sp. FACHB-261]